MVKRQGILNRISFFSSCVHIMSHLFLKKIRKILVPHEMLVSIALTDLRYLYWICREMHYPTWDDVISRGNPREMQVSLVLSHVRWRHLTRYPTWDAGISRVIPTWDACNTFLITREMHEKIWYSLVAASHALRPVSEMYLTCYYAWDACTSRGNNTWDTCMSRGMTREAPVSDALVLRLTRWLCISRVNPAPHACPGCISRVKNLDQLIYCLLGQSTPS